MRPLKQLLKKFIEKFNKLWLCQYKQKNIERKVKVQIKFLIQVKRIHLDMNLVNVCRVLRNEKFSIQRTRLQFPSTQSTQIESKN